ncbi:PREDICTED: NADH dehydrogenase [ubiquinone] 1 subunit C1, mitochondrial isoform X2 [Pseudopodoces humilis]|uniref:NADH dehydrogenase [ubiquinone] 1 subunit C1, mitochondrial isoform X1 n=1 Tax=Pseudopodoces humilis TaxID=181119 RepID=UPI0006B7AF1C|nr:PREDICTED: NADH dehydrogenase [ubiquinone] 1 subunit C1, mitochondrial isoform X1 [Pseudopodoces humilis]XP_014110230.1 PREDICTED: NADH dehydrogenase [ubiquinone] 1 subunit C1, mitochondrial isoform X2 [Pseudopodoces humilis]
MAAGLRAVRRWGLVVAAVPAPPPPSLAFTRSAFVVKKMNNAQPNWLRVGLAFSTSAALWAFLIKQHNEDVMEYERRNKRGHKCTGCS